MRWLAAGLAIATVATVAVTAGCDDSSAPGHDPGKLHGYVALGDSYTTGSGIGAAVEGAGAGCGQTVHNYPRLVAEKLGLELRDASCAGARTDHAFMNQTVDGDQVWPAQLNQLSHDTDLVTVSFGYNDLDYFVDALINCVSAVASSPGATACPEGGTTDTVTDSQAAAAEIGRRLESVLEQVRSRAPDARVLVVGYPQLVPAKAQCPELGLLDAGYAEARRDLGRLDDAMRDAAEDADATYVDVFGASEGHDVCAGADAWVNGATEQPGVAVAYHPLQAEQDAVAALIEDAVAGS